MATLDGLSCYQNQPIQRNFSVRKVERLAVKLATKLCEKVPEGYSDFSAFADYLHSVTGYEFVRTRQMLQELLPLRGRRDMIRVAYAIIGYLPCFDKEDMQLESRFAGQCSFPVHGRIISAVVKPITEKQIGLEITFLAMSSILSGRLITRALKERDAKALLKRVYCGRRDLKPYVGLGGTYCCMDSTFLYDHINSFYKISEVVKLNTEEKRLNVELYKNRERLHTCGNCYSCKKGRSECKLAVRAFSIKENKK